MDQLLEMRSNPVEFPKIGKANVLGHELIFVTSRTGYGQDMHGKVIQVAETHTYRFMATSEGLGQAVATGLSLLTPEIRAMVMALDFSEVDAAAAKKTKK
jgi:hypothetical protein